MKRRILFLSCILLCSCWGYGQTWKQFKKEAQKAFQNEAYGETLYYLDTLQKIDSAKFNLFFLQAEAAKHYNAFELAEKSYKKVLSQQQAEFYPPATLGLATVQKMQGNYTEAINGFEDYLIINPDTTQSAHQEAKSQIQACKWAMDLIKINDEDLKIERLGNDVNTDFSDFAPVKYQDQLLFSSLRFKSTSKKANNAKKYAKVLVYDEKMGMVEPFDLGTNEEELHTAHLAFNKSRDKMYFNICKFSEGLKIQCKIYYRSQTSDTTWSKATLLPEAINQPKASISQPNIGYDKEKDQEMLFYITERTGGKGSTDIWMAYLNENGLPMEPTNLGEVNTDKAEFSPFYHNYTQTLYFSSEGRRSLGGFDIFKTTLKDGKWQEVTHTGYPLNSSYNDVYFSLNHIGSVGYLASNREGTLFLDKQISACCNDIFKADFNSYLLDLKVLTYAETDNGEKELKAVKVTVYEIFEDAEQRVPQKLDPIGNSHFYQIKSNKKYKIVAEKDNYFPGELIFTTEEPTKGDLITKKVHLKPLRLNVLTFTDEPPMAPLTNVNLVLYEINEKGERIKIDSLYIPEKNSFFFPLLSNKKYRIIAQKEGYDIAIEEFSTAVWTSKTSILTKKVILPREELSITIKSLKPFSLYFDNDFPKPGAIDTLTEFTFPETIEKYKSRKQLFKDNYTEGLQDFEKEAALKEMDYFFESEIDSTYQEFLKVTDAVLKRLKFGRAITIRVQAYASPLASEDYNLKLTKRRISSMVNFYRTYKNNAMEDYVNSGKLIIELAPYGESKAPKNISDNPRDRRNSVFGIEASRQRKVKIIQVESKKNGKNSTNKNKATQSLE